MPGFEIPDHIFEAVAKRAREGAPGALSIGSKVMKIDTEDDQEEHTDGTVGTIVGSLDVSHVPRPPGMTLNVTPKYMYLVDFQDKHGKPVFVMDFKVVACES